MGRWRMDEIPFAKKGFGFNGPKSIFNEPVRNLDNTSASANTSSMYIMYARVNGYAWTSTGKAQQAAVVALGFHILLALVHTIISHRQKILEFMGHYA
ncbi:hypothetical protein GJ744_002307 [Endocarpon pusillum]|uniref:Uncharacterized protein n=1 Tax=Endocarpon pusillum TaxID=364733 RepID=A0A8H7AMV7_9EURO|nr:hypothetical protein GJ744_002307 [Endocarpon pusillum]